MYEDKVVSLGDYHADVEAALKDLHEREVVPRIWGRDHTVWKPEPTEITDRLGWLTVTETMAEHLEALRGFAEEVRGEGYQHVVLLGMGGSSLGPEVLRQTFGKAEGFPALIVLDSTVPAWIQSVTDSINPAQTLFIVSSKSGTTVEPNTFYRYFRGLVEQSVEDGQAGRNFVAITDPETALERLAHEQGFRRVFPNPPDIGGRYSVQSFFGLVPAALAGIDVAALVDRVDSMRKACGPELSPGDNPGAWLGAVMGKLASKGLDKLTIVTSPSVESFGLWAEQLIAESTGKEGRGIVPVAGEPLLGPDHYGDDRVFVYLRLGDDDNAATDAAMEGIEGSGQPVVRLELRDRYDLGAEFFRWEFATAVAGAILGIQPFDQPNVQQAKDITDQVLKEYLSSGSEPSPEPTSSLSELLSRARARDYLAIMAYLHRTPEIDEALASLRRKVMERYQIATTLGYGPRFLHSTGQLHKGGPGSGLFLQITADIGQDISIPGESYSFGVLANAQAKGDLGALQSQGRRVTSVNIGSEGASAIRQFVNDTR